MSRGRITEFLAWFGHATVEAIRRYFVAGLLSFAPIAVTIAAIAWIIQRLDNLLLPRVIDWLMPGSAPPELPPLVGAIFTFLVILLAGVVVRHLFGHEVVRLSERALLRVPIARSIYGGVKQLVEAIFVGQRTQSFNRVVAVEYPRRGIYALAFTTGPSQGKLAEALPGDMVNVFVPTTPNPTSGVFILVPREDLTDVDLSVEDAFKVIMSAGIVNPTGDPLADTPPAPPELVPAARAASDR